MTAEALAIVFSPNLLRAPQNDFVMILNNMGLSHKLVKALITHVSFSLLISLAKFLIQELSSTQSSMKSTLKGKYIQMMTRMSSIPRFLKKTKKMKKIMNLCTTHMIMNPLNIQNDIPLLNTQDYSLLLITNYFVRYTCTTLNLQFSNPAWLS